MLRRKKGITGSLINNPGILKVVFTFFPAILFIAVGCNINQNAEDDILLTVNGEPVYRNEFTLIQSWLKPEVFSYFAINHGAVDGPDFWGKKINGEIPSEVLTERTITELTRIVTEKLLMREYGIIDDISFAGFIEELEKENNRRKKAAAEGLPVYGPLQVDEKIYYEYLRTERVEKLKKNLAVKKINITGKEINDYYCMNIEKFRKPSDDNAAGNDPENFWPIDQVKDYIAGELLDEKFLNMIKILQENAEVIIMQEREKLMIER